MLQPFAVAVSVVALSFGLVSGCGSDSSPSGESSASPSATSNGVGDLPANEALKKVQAAVEGATSVHFSGSGTADDGEKVDLDVKTEIDGDATATLKVKGQQIDLLVVGDTGYLKANKAFWQEQADSATAILFQDKWIKFPKTSSDFAGFLEFTQPGNLIEVDKGTSLETGDPTTINGVAVFALVDPSPKDGGTLYAASSGAPLPVQLAYSGDATGNKIDFDEWNEPITVTAPDPGDVIDPSTAN